MVQGGRKDWGGGASLEHRIDEMKLSSLNARVVRFSMIWIVHGSFIPMKRFLSVSSSNHVKINFFNVSSYLMCMNLL